MQYGYIESCSLVCGLYQSTLKVALLYIRTTHCQLIDSRAGRSPIACDTHKEDLSKVGLWRNTDRLHMKSLFLHNRISNESSYLMCDTVLRWLSNSPLFLSFHMTDYKSLQFLSSVRTAIFKTVVLVLLSLSTLALDTSNNSCT